MENKDDKFKLRLGIFVAGGLAIMLAVLFYLGKQKNLFNSTFQLTTVYKDIGGLQVGNHVRFSGINIGSVELIEILNDTSVRVEMIVSSDVRKFIKKDAVASVGSEGLMGDKVINISHGTVNSEPVEKGFMIRSTEPVNTEAILATLQSTGENAEIATGELAEILYKINNGNGTLSRLIADSTIAENLDQTISNLKTGSKNLNQNMEAAKKSILFRGYFKKKEREAEKKREEAEEQNEEEKK